MAVEEPPQAHAVDDLHRGVLGIDVGTSGTKTLAIDAAGKRRALDVQARAEALDDARLGVEAALALGGGFWRIGDSETALSVIENEIDRAFRLGDRELLAALHRVLGVTLSEIGGHVAGVATLERAFGYALESGVPQAICECANSLGGAIYASCRNADPDAKADALANAEAMIRTSLDVATEEGDLPAIAARATELLQKSGQ